MNEWLQMSKLFCVCVLIGLLLFMNEQLFLNNETSALKNVPSVSSGNKLLLCNIRMNMEIIELIWMIFIHKFAIIIMRAMSHRQIESHISKFSVASVSFLLCLFFDAFELFSLSLSLPFLSLSFFPPFFCFPFCYRIQYLGTFLPFYLARHSLHTLNPFLS